MTANWISLDNMLTVDKTLVLDQEKYFEANKLSTCDINSNRIILSLNGLIIAFLISLVLRPKSEYFVVDAAVIR